MSLEKKPKLIAITDQNGVIRYFTPDELRPFLIEKFGQDAFDKAMQAGDLARQTKLPWKYENGSLDPDIGKG